MNNFRNSNGDFRQPDLFAEKASLLLPPRYHLQGHWHSNLIEQLNSPAVRVDCAFQQFSVKQVVGWETRLPTGQLLRIISKGTSTKIDADFLLLAQDAATLRDVEIALEHGHGKWMHPKPVRPKSESEDAAHQRPLSVPATWTNAFHLKEGKPKAGNEPELPGMRRPQVGAIHAALAHATRSTAPATIVMPTGTGKTETMLGLLAAQLLARILVVVPTDALRDQISDKFLTFGILKKLGCLESSAAYPVVLRLEHRPDTPDDVDKLFARANVIVTTIHVAGQASAGVQARMAEWAEQLFIDEAHHIGAKSWADFRSLFVEKEVPIIQFTATPFREDGRKVDGEFIYTYPLKKAQQENYFKRIRFEAVCGLDREEADQAIVEKVGEILEQDDKAGLTHLAMARCRTIARATALHQIYEAAYPEFRPISGS